MKSINVGLAEWRVTRNPNERLSAIGLGSSVALVLYDPIEQIAAMAHIMLPSGREDERFPCKYAEHAVPFLVEQALGAGAEPPRLRVAVFGGATLLVKGQSLLLEIGQRNVTAIGEALARLDLKPVVADVGGTKGRTVTLQVGTGELTVRVLGEPDRIHDDFATSSEVSQ